MKLTQTNFYISALLLGLSFLLFSPASFADNNNRAYKKPSSSHTRYVYADVVDVQPILRYVKVSRPERVCEDVQYRERSRHPHNSANNTIAGGLLGGVIGRQFGGGKGRDAATIAGVLIGSAIGHDNETNKDRNRGGRADEVYTREECHTRYERHEEERIDGYNVVYRYQGEEFSTRTRYEPGDKIRIALSARPAPDYQSSTYRDGSYRNRSYSERRDDRDEQGSYDDDRYENYDYDD